MDTQTLMPNRILPKGTGYWLLTLYPIGGDFHRTVLDTPVTVEETFNNCHGSTARGRIVATGMRIAYNLGLTEPEA